MAHFNLSPEDFNDENSLMRGITANQVNTFQGQVIDPMQTSWSQESAPARSLTSWSVSDILQGAPLVRSERQVLQTLNQRISGRSAMFKNSVLASEYATQVDTNLTTGTGYDTLQSGLTQSLMSQAGSLLGGSPIGPGGQDHAYNGQPSQGGFDRPPRTGGIEDVLNWGLTRVGVPYNQCIGRAKDPPCDEGNVSPTLANPTVSGRFGPNWHDCSGFVTSAFLFGMGLELSAGGNYNTTYTMLDNPELMATEVPASQRQPGDVMLYTEHVGFYFGDGQILDSGSPGVTVRNGSWMESKPGLVYLRIQNLAP